MKVVDHSEHHWILLASGDRLLLDVNCSQGAFSYCFLMELNESECARYKVEGRAYLGRLADDIQDSGAASLVSKSAYKTRNIHSAELGNAKSEAFTRFRKEKSKPA